MKKPDKIIKQEFGILIHAKFDLAQPKGWQALWIQWRFLTDQQSKRPKALLLAMLEQYLRFGFYPEVALRRDELIQKTLQSYFDVADRVKNS